MNASSTRSPDAGPRGGTEQEDERAEVRDALAHLTLIVNPRDRAAFARAICTRRGIGPGAVARLAAFATDEGIDLLAAARRAGDVTGLKAEQVNSCEQFGGALRLVAEQAGAVGVAGQRRGVRLRPAGPLPAPG